MTYSNDWAKVILAEIKPGIELNDLVWTLDLTVGITELDFYEYATDDEARTAYWLLNTEPTGGTITTSGTKRIHTFTSSGTFELPAGVSGNVEVLVIGGGGGGGRLGGSNATGGGGGGGKDYSAAVALAAGESVAVTVGTGGAGATTSAPGSDGNDSVFKALTGPGGGGGGGLTVGNNGGCGGGGGTDGATGYAGGVGSAGGDGGAGSGDASTLANRAGGGGGGAGGNGQDASAGVGGNGGDGFNSSISGASVNYGGGGGGSSQGATQGSGTDGGGDGSQTADGEDGTDGLGGGGGGACDNFNGGDGGDGVVIVSYEREDFKTLQIYSESTIKTQGSYSIKGVAVATDSLDNYMLRTVSPTIDLSDKDTIYFDIRASRTGTNIQVNIHDAVGGWGLITKDVNVLVADTWQTETIDISGIANANKSAIDYIQIKIIDATAANTFYIDNMFGSLTVPETWYLDLNVGEIIDVKQNGNSLTQATSLFDCYSIRQTFFYDFWAQRLYVHLTDGADPGSYSSGPEYLFSIIGYFWLGFSNGQFEGDYCLDFIPDGCIHPIFYEPWLNENSIDALSATVSDHFETAMEIQFGSLALINNGWWYLNRHTLLWNNADVRVKVGQRGDSYSDFETIFIGKARNLKINDQNASFELVDTRVGELYSIPRNRYNLTDYPNLEDDAVDIPIPILFGEKTNISPVCINTATWVYNISDTTFNGVTFPLQAIDKVYRGGAQLILATDYTVDLNAGTFTLLADPGDAEITCDAKGIKDEFDFSTGLKTGDYSENVADHLFFIFTVLNEIPIAKMDLASFLELQTARTQKVALLLDADTPTMEVNRLFQQSTIYHFLPLLNGNFAARYYRRTVPVGTKELQYYNFADFNIFDQAENVHYQIIIKYDKDPTTGIFKTVSIVDDDVKWKYNEKQAIEIETALRDVAEAESVRGFYSTLFNAPADKFEADISLEFKDVLPTDKLIVSRSVQSDIGEISILNEEIYAILETHKDLTANKMHVVGQLDSQIAIFAIHADSPHQDSHSDHSDTVHGDASHSDHTDSSHEDHTDNTHGDSHTDEAHIDHMDGIYEDQDYMDVPHVDTTYNDHDDSHIDEPHVNSAHSDHSDTSHADEHTDVSHIDSEV